MAPADRVRFRPAPAAPAPGAAGRGDVLRVLTCGSVDDGKSTLLGRLLKDTGQVFDDQLLTLARDSATAAGPDGELDLSLLLDGLQAEREQGITIDVAYRYFATARRKFIVADTPGHEQYTRNMATGASVSDVAIILVDARQGVLTQTRRHLCICALLGIGHVVLAVNKMDLVDYAQSAFATIEQEFTAFAARLGIAAVTCIPLSARAGEGVTEPSARMPWHAGPDLLGHLESIEPAQPGVDGDLRLSVQWVNRPRREGDRGYSGTISSGSLAVGDAVVVYPSGSTSRVAKLIAASGETGRIGAGAAVTVSLEDHIDVSRGNVIAGGAPPEVSDQIAANLIWMAGEPMLPGRTYAIKCGAQWANATITVLKHKLSVETLDHIAGTSLALNEIGSCTLAFDRPLVFDPYARSRSGGSFILVDKRSNATVGAGMIEFGLRRAANVRWQSFDVDKAVRAAAKRQRPCCLWMTGLSGAGKSTIANALERELVARSHHTYVLDGDNVRHGLNRDLGFTDADRVENIRRVAEVARLMTDAGLIVIVSFISPFRAERRMAREMFDPGEFLEIHVDTPLAVCERRDPKGLYRKARAGEIKNFTGIDSEYEVPEAAEVVVDGSAGSAEDHAARILQVLHARDIL